MATVGALGGPALAGPTPYPSAKPKQTQTSPAKPRTKIGNIGYQVVVGNWVIADAGGFVRVAADCPAGMQVLSGGEENTISGGVVLTVSYPESPTRWTSFAANTSSGTASVRGYAVCGSGISGHQIVTNDFNVGGNSSIGFAGTCPQGKLALGGGESNSNPNGGLRIGSSFNPPTSGGSYFWGVDVVNTSLITQNWRLFTMCGGGLSRYQRVQGPDVNLPAGGFGSASATCPDGMVALGGGGLNASRGEAVLTDSFPTGDGRGWSVYSKNISNDGSHVHVDVVCGA
ncbi:hypothetical protein [Actinomadura rubrisoli]|uniref:Uncharacterized protein n=1 Tax=Actinomadura rubrisoli TaxID=2530368 RepID=A0A4R5BKC2_9ACTN|nr:hypothetical protein [Actinomadura rubrisoli]TDD87111.1 hypothetical protein E1298_16600 [Actinomadura rubrisoli]